MDIETYARFLLALIFILALLGGLYILLKRIERRGVGVGGPRRIGVVEARAVDQRRRLVLVRRDDREHLLLIGGGADLVVETDIAAPPMTEDIDAEASQAVDQRGLAARIAGLRKS